MDVTPRFPTSIEKAILAEAIQDNCENFAEAMRIVNDSCIAVFDNYMSDTPGYCGKVMVVVYPGGPSIYQVYTFSTIAREVLELMEQE